MNEATNLHQALNWLKEIIADCLQIHVGQSEDIAISPLKLQSDDSWLFKFIAVEEPSFEELVILLLGLTPHLYPHFFSKLIAEYLPDGGDFAEFGGVKGTNHRGLLPTGETAQFILAGNNLEKRLQVQSLFSSEHWFAQKQLLWLESVREGEPVMSGRLLIDPEIIEQLTLGTVSKPHFSMEFPAQHLQTQMDWADLVLHPNTLQQIHDIENWIKHSDTLLYDWDMQKKIKPGYRALFYGPPGTGKTMTATLLGKYTDKTVFRIDLSRVVSKYIGETEKNLSRLFDKAEHKNWLLFFDEADALFGKRTDIRDAHDKYANQEVAYLLQRIETYNGLVILASNQRANIDEAFVRRFQALIHFPMPRAEERQQIWRQAFPKQIAIADDVDWQMIGARFELSGANIMNISHFCALALLTDDSRCLDLKRLEVAIMREFIKEGRL